ncbi:MAG: SH3 domain-containing protein [Oscillospiraceae bacterium]|nr:SH3 domain-containing protein [Oscillospiraceae bacterium]
MKTAAFRRLFALCIVLTLLVSIVPVSHADEYYGMSVSEIMQKFDSRVQKPKSSSVLDRPETVYVQSTYGNCIYVYSGPSKTSSKLFRADEGKAVTVYARQSGFALGIVKGTSIGGWMREELLSRAYDYDVPGPHDTEGLSSKISRPVKNEYLPEYETMYVKSKYGNCIYMYDDPAKDYPSVIERVSERAECTLIARRDNMYFVWTEFGQRGWVEVAKLVYDYPW